MGNSKTFRQNIAFAVSRILGPVPLICVGWFVMAFKSGIGFWKAIWVYPLIFLLTIAFPLLITTYLIATKRVSGIEWKNVHERKKYLPPIMVFTLITLNLLTYLFTNSTIFHLSLLFSAIMLTGVMFWIFDKKISAHMIVAVATFSTINLYFHLQFLWIFLLLVPIFWARYTLNVHSGKQLIAGILMPLGFIFLGLLLFGWPAVP